MLVEVVLQAVVHQVIQAIVSQVAQAVKLQAVTEEAEGIIHKMK